MIPTQGKMTPPATLFMKAPFIPRATHQQSQISCLVLGLAGGVGREGCGGGGEGGNPRSAGASRGRRPCPGLDIRPLPGPLPKRT